MKKLFILLAVCYFYSTLTIAQSIGLRVGYNISSVKWKSEGSTNINQFNNAVISKSGFQIGANFDIPLSKTFSFEPGIYFSSKGYRFKSQQIINGVSVENVSKTTLNYLNIPIYIKVGLDVGSNRLFVATGPYIGMGLNIDNSNSIGAYNKFDYGLSFATGIEIGRFEVIASYDYGLKNIRKDTFIKSYNQSLNFSLGYRVMKE